MSELSLTMRRNSSRRRGIRQVDFRLFRRARFRFHPGGKESVNKHTQERDGEKQDTFPEYVIYESLSARLRLGGKACEVCRADGVIQGDEQLGELAGGGL